MTHIKTAHARTLETCDHRRTQSISTSSSHSFFAGNLTLHWAPTHTHTRTHTPHKATPARTHTHTTNARGIRVARTLFGSGRFVACVRSFKHATILYTKKPSRLSPVLGGWFRRRRSRRSRVALSFSLSLSLCVFPLHRRRVFFCGRLWGGWYVIRVCCWGPVDVCVWGLM